MDSTKHEPRLDQDPHGIGTAGGRLLEQSIGREVRAFREKLGLTIAELAKGTGISAGMLSKIENGATSPSLGSLQALGKALQDAGELNAVVSQEGVVRKTQFPRAEAALHDLRHRPQRTWHCPACGELIEGGFEQCWQCGEMMRFA